MIGLRVWCVKDTPTTHKHGKVQPHPLDFFGDDGGYVGMEVKGAGPELE